MIRFIHLADVHLGAVPDRGCPWSHEREEEIWETFPPGHCVCTQRSGGFLVYSGRSLSPAASFKRTEGG